MLSVEIRRQARAGSAAVVMAGRLGLMRGKVRKTKEEQVRRKQRRFHIDLSPRDALLHVRAITKVGPADGLLRHMAWRRE